MTYGLSTMMNLKRITAIFILMSWNSRTKIKTSSKASFLDLSVEVNNRRFTTKLFNEKDVFPIYINCMPYLDSNIPSKFVYTSAGSEIWCIVRITANWFICVNFLLIQYIKCVCIILQLNKIFGKLFKVFHMFVHTADEFVKLFFFFFFFFFFF